MDQKARFKPQGFFKACNRFFDHLFYEPCKLGNGPLEPDRTRVQALL
ncbi:hypothetical protein D3OALGB2SA_2435 [Olavius algarvensis associated proteobacterium Delta 3]|nr:hypothetical protein D3OALGB2SA_2435 [Olavius algarvensis associated proteobacterium Delta 3]